MASKHQSKSKSRRPLTLHVSALSDAEFTAYTEWLGEIVGPLDGVQVAPDNQKDDGDFGNDVPRGNDDKIISRTRTGDGDWDPEGTLVGVREARGWIRGRWGNGRHALDGVVIDSILKNFSPDLAPQDIITGGQFFAVMRLVCHAQEQKQSQNGREGTPIIDESLVFVQANPDYSSPESSQLAHKKVSSASSVLSDLSASTSTSVSARKLRPPPPPVPPPRQPSEILPNQAHPAAPSEPKIPPNAPNLPPRLLSSTSPHSNPFTRALASNLPTSDKTLAAPTNVTSSSLSEPSRNPFRPIKPPPPPPPPFPIPQSSPTLSESDDSSSPPSKRQTTGSLPPLPPRKTAILPPPRHSSIKLALPHSHLTTTTIPTTTYVPPPLPPPAPPPKPPKVTSPLIKQSLEAAKNAQNLKASLDNLSRERQLEIIKKSGSGVTGTTGSGVIRKSDGERQTARSMSPPRSMYDVATAQLRGYQTQRVLSSTSASASASVSSLSSSVSSSGISNEKDSRRSFTGSKPKLLTDTSSSALSTSRTPLSPSFPPASPFSPSTYSPGGSNPRRTKSLHHPSPSTAPLHSASVFPFTPAGSNQPPPPPRRRPESIQVFRSINETNTPSKISSPNPFTSPSQEQGQNQALTQDWPPPKLASSNPNAVKSSRRISTSTTATQLSEQAPSHGRSSPPLTSAGIAVFDTLQRTFSSLSTLKPGPGFESARIRAEGRVLPSGFSKVGGKGKGMEKERLMDDVDNDGGNEIDRGRLSGSYERGRGTDRVTRDDTGLSGLSQDSAMDNLKIPVQPNEGWVSLS